MTKDDVDIRQIDNRIDIMFKNVKKQNLYKQARVEEAKKQKENLHNGTKFYLAGGIGHNAVYTKDNGINVSDRENNTAISLALGFENKRKLDVYGNSDTRIIKSLELFYDYLNLDLDQRYYISKNSNNGIELMSIKQMYGVKVKLGVQILNRISLYVSAGVVYWDKTFNLPTYDENHNITPIYGFGINTYINPNFAINAEYSISNMTYKGIENIGHTNSYSNDNLYFKTQSINLKIIAYF